MASGIQRLKTFIMFKEKHWLFALLFLLSNFTGGLSAQLIAFHEDRDILTEEPFVGFNIGYSFYSISGFEGTLGASLSDAGTYNFTEGKIGAIDIGLTFMAPLDDPGYLFGQLDVDYIIPVLPDDQFARAHVLYDDTNDLSYAFNATYQRVHIRPTFGAFLTTFLSLRVGLDWGINTTPADLRYNSSDPTLGRDLAIQEELIDKLEGKNSLGLLVYPEIQIPFADYGTILSVGAAYSYGFTDVVSTRANNYRLQETNNRLTSLSLRLSGKFIIAN